MPWLNDKHVKNRFEQIKSERTIKNYTERFPEFLEWCKKRPTQIIESRLEHLTTTDLAKRRHWEIQLIRFTRYLESFTDNEGKRCLGTDSIHGCQSAVRSFFSHNGCNLQFVRGDLDIEPSEREKVLKEWIPSNEEAGVLYRACKSAHGRSVLLVLYQSGFSGVDVASMKIEDFDFYDKNGNWKPEPYTGVYYARLREKTSILQQTCISREARESNILMVRACFRKSEC